MLGCLADGGAGRKSLEARSRLEEIFPSSGRLDEKKMHIHLYRKSGFGFVLTTLFGSNLLAFMSQFDNRAIPGRDFYNCTLRKTMVSIIVKGSLLSV